MRDNLVDFLNENKFMALLVFLALTNVLICLFLLGRSGPEFVVVDNKTDVKPNKLTFCTVAAKQMLNKKMSDKVFEKEIVLELSRDNYKQMDLSGKEVFNSVSINETGCQISWSDELGIRAFHLTIMENNPIASILYNVKEIQSL